MNHEGETQAPSTAYSIWFSYHSIIRKRMMKRQVVILDKGKNHSIGYDDRGEGELIKRREKKERRERERRERKKKT